MPSVKTLDLRLTKQRQERRDKVGSPGGVSRDKNRNTHFCPAPKRKCPEKKAFRLAWGWWS